MNIQKLRAVEHGILAIGAHTQIIQSMLDFDYLAGKECPSVCAIITAGRKTEKFFWGHDEVIIPCFASLQDVPGDIRKRITLFLSVQSARRAARAADDFLLAFPDALGGHIFSEGLSEQDALHLSRTHSEKYFIAGPAGVGLLIPGVIKLGAIGGTTVEQIEKNHVTHKGSVAIISASGGMTNEMIATLARGGCRVSFAICVGGDRFPFITPLDAFLAAEEDPETKTVVYYGELGGRDEYDIVSAISDGRLTKPVHAYIAGTVDAAFEGETQFGHAKALAQSEDESALAKQNALRDAGVHVGASYADFIASFETIERDTDIVDDPARSIQSRQKTLFTSREVIDPFKSDNTLDAIRKGRAVAPHKYVTMIQEALLGRPVMSQMLPLFTETVYEILIDHGPHVSGAVNTMVTARAGKNMIDSLCAGLLTIGPRFGGAINDAAQCWYDGVQGGGDAETYVEQKARAGEYILGIGHKKYRVGMPDPRITLLRAFTERLESTPYLDFALAVEKITTQKKGNLILNVDGAVAAIMMDILVGEEHYTESDIRELIDMEYFNTFFIIPRSIGFIAHFLEQKRNDEGLFRLPDDLMHIK